LKQAAAEVLPRWLLAREDKTGFAAPLGAWLSRDPWAEEHLRRLETRGFAIPVDVRRGKYDRSRFTAVMVELWHQHYVDGAMAGGDTQVFQRQPTS
jgi:hypothetical protein